MAPVKATCCVMMLGLWSTLVESNRGFSVASMELIGRVRARQRPKEQPKTATRRLEWCYVVTSDDG